MSRPRAAVRTTSFVRRNSETSTGVKLVIRIPARDIAEMLTVEDTLSVSDLFDALLRNKHLYFLDRRYHFLSVKDRGTPLPGNYSLKQVLANVCTNFHF